MKTTLLFVGDENGLRGVVDRVRHAGKRRASEGFGLWLRKTRFQMDMTQVEFAKIVGKHPVTLSRWETGDLVPSEDTEQQIVNLIEEHQGF